MKLSIKLFEVGTECDSINSTLLNNKGEVRQVKSPTCKTSTEVSKELALKIKSIQENCQQMMKKIIKPKNLHKKSGKKEKVLKEENLSIISINARGFASKRKSIEEILKNNNIDIAVVSEISGNNLRTFTGYKMFVKSAGHMQERVGPAECVLAALLCFARNLYLRSDFCKISAHLTAV